MINKNNLADYFLFFGTNGYEGLKKIKQAMWRVNPMGGFQFSDATADPNQPTLFTLEPDFDLLKEIILFFFIP